MHKFYEFFAGGGMARAGLGDTWSCTFANDFSKMKAETYRANWGDDHFHEGDVRSILPDQMPGSPDLVWASTPCQDLSLAGNAVGLGQREDPSTRSGAFWPWWAQMETMAAEGRKPPIVVFENVIGALTSNAGADFAVVAGAFAAMDYSFGAIVVDAKLFLPQSRPRLFVIGFDKKLPLPRELHGFGPQVPWHPQSMLTAFDHLPESVQKAWVWWSLPLSMVRRPDLASLIQSEPVGVKWHAAATTRKLISAMSPANKAKLHQAQAYGGRIVGTVYKRTRPDTSGKKVCRTEVRFDGIAGCLRTPSGGSSRQTVMIVEGDRVRTRLLSPREAARLMGLPETYKLPERYNDAYHICGDGVAVPVVRHLASHLLEPMAAAASLADMRDAA